MTCRITNKADAVLMVTEIFSLSSASSEKPYRNPIVKRFLVVSLAMLLFVGPVLAAGGTPSDTIRQTIDKLLVILKDPQLKGGGKEKERREKLKEAIQPAFDFTEMAKRSLASEWRRRSPEEQKEFVKLFTCLLEAAYLDKIESYNGEKVQYVREREEGDFAEVDTIIVDAKRGQAFSVDYRLHKVDRQWKVYDVVIENISLVNNYRSQFNRVLAKVSFNDLLKRMKEKAL